LHRRGDAAGRLEKGELPLDDRDRLRVPSITGLATREDDSSERDENAALKAALPLPMI
jgi:hypothetical protein